MNIYFAALTYLPLAETEIFIYRGSCSRCKDFVDRSQAGPVALSADHGQAALSFLLCRPCLNWLVERCAVVDKDCMCMDISEDNILVAQFHSSQVVRYASTLSVLL